MLCCVKQNDTCLPQSIVAACCCWKEFSTLATYSVNLCIVPKKPNLQSCKNFLKTNHREKFSQGNEWMQQVVRASCTSCSKGQTTRHTISSWKQSVALNMTKTCLLRKNILRYDLPWPKVAVLGKVMATKVIHWVCGENRVSRKQKGHCGLLYLL